jgi:Polyketide cyclase / dehydrase and lipid transport
VPYRVDPNVEQKRGVSTFAAGVLAVGSSAGARKRTTAAPSVYDTWISRFRPPRGYNGERPSRPRRVPEPSTITNREGSTMPRAYYSTVFEQSANTVWRTIRCFDEYAWAGTGVDAEMEDGKAGDAVGGVRRVATPDQPIRQRLLAHSDVNRCYTYEFCDPVPFAVRDYRATLRVTPVTDGDRAFVEWWATFECAEDERDHWVKQFRGDGFASWLGSLRRQLAA